MDFHMNYDPIELVFGSHFFRRQGVMQRKDLVCCVCFRSIYQVRSARIPHDGDYRAELAGLLTDAFFEIFDEQTLLFSHGIPYLICEEEFADGYSFRMFFDGWPVKPCPNKMVRLTRENSYAENLRSFWLTEP